LLEQIKQTSDKNTSFTMPSWLQPASGCSPWDLGTLPDFAGGLKIEFNMCPAMPLITGALSFLWVMCTFFACHDLVRRTTLGG
jgi:hypothetical protein